MNCSRIALRLREQIHKLAKGFQSLTKPKQRFMEEMVYGICSAPVGIGDWLRRS